MRVHKILIAALFVLHSGHSLSQSENELPTAEQFQSLLSTCAAGARIEIDGEIRGSFTSVYEGAKTEASGFKILTLTDFLNSLPPEDKLAGFKLYNECVLKILRGDLSEAEQIPEVVELPAQIVTFGEPLEIKAVTLVANNAEIRAFPSGSRAASGESGANGANGANGKNGSGGGGGDGRAGGAGGHGANGHSAGPIVIEAETLIGDLRIFNNGVAGGNGGAGGSGGAGGQGKSSVSGLFDCSSGPGNGGAGGSAGAGGDGGRGGNGGAGGTVTVRLGSVAEGSTLAITSIGGAAGQPGNPGRPGSPGRGGPRGNTGGNCGGGGRVAGADGAPAGAGRNLGPGQIGTDGQIEVIIGSETIIGSREFSRAF